MKRMAAIFAVCLMLGLYALACVPIVNADAGQQKWSLLNKKWNSKPYIGVMQKGDAVSDTNHNIYTDPSSRIWVANDAASATVDMSGNWIVRIKYSSGVPAPDIYIGSFDPSTSDFNPDTTTGFTSRGSYLAIPQSTEFTVTTSNHVIPAGHYLAIKIVNNNGESGTCIYTTESFSYPGVPRCYVKSPSSDPGYPVPELSTMVLMSSGLVAGIGMLAYSSRKKLAK